MDPNLPKNQNQIPVTTSQAVHQQAAYEISDELKKILGSDHPVMPVNEETPLEIKSNEDLVERWVYNRPGTEPSRNFLKRLTDRVHKKNPDADVKLVKK